MRKISLLDCTLRDGGYINDWEFGHDNLISVYRRLIDAKVDIVEVGFLDERRPYDWNRSVFPNTKSISDIWSGLGVKPFMVVGMIDFGTCSIDNLEMCDDSLLDGIRVIFKKGKMYDAMKYCAKVKEKGYKVFVQLVSITAYTDTELLELVELVNEVQPFAVSMVDTYGLLNPKTLLHYYETLDENVCSQIKIGFHAHNNLQSAYSNSCAFVDYPTERDILVDGTLYGMGKSAGNAPLELVGMYLNKNYYKDYDIKSMLESIEESIKEFYIKSPWGYNTCFYMSAVNECHPNYVEFFQNKGNLSISKVFELLSLIEPKEKKLLFDCDLAENLYRNFLADHMSDENMFIKLAKELNNRKILIVGPGKNIKLQKDIVENYISTNNPIIISINYVPDEIAVNYVFVTKLNRYKEMTTKLINSEIKIIATSNLECKNGKFDYSICREPLLEHKEEIKDNSFLMLLKVLKRVNITNIACAGLDGYSEREENYVVPNMEYEFVKQAASHLNQHIRYVLLSEYMDLNIEFITYSHYAVVEDINSATF